MSQEKNTGDQATGAVPEKELVGDTLRKERITRRITVETIAKDLKLNVKYIKALESNEYEGLPADPYVRVYLRSLAKYLTLDSEAILKKFYAERGMIIEKTPKESSERIVISVRQKEESHRPMFVLAIVLIAALALFSFIAKKKGWLVTPPQSTPAALVPIDAEFVETDAGNDSTLADSLIPVIPPQQGDSVQSAVASQAIPATSADAALSLNLKISVVTDSVWIQVFSDGVSWKNVIYKNQSRDFAAKDSFNVHVGNLAGVKCHLNGKQISVLGKGVTAFKVDKNGKATKWALIKWNSVFSGRL